MTDWLNFKPYSPLKPGHHILSELNLNVISGYIDWTFFFFSWKVSGKYPAIFNDPVKGEEARKLFDDAQVYIKEIIDRKLITAKAVFGLFPAASEGDDVKVYSDTDKHDTKIIFRFLRNQETK